MAASAQLRTELTEIVIPFTPVDGQDHLVLDLHREDVLLFDNGSRRPLTSMVLEDGPASIIFLLDVSGSMRKAVRYIRDAVSRIVRDGDADDEFGIVEFSNEATLSVELTKADSQVSTRLRNLSPAGRTSLVDAVMVSLQHIKQGTHARKAIVIVSDGQDNHSRFRERDAIRLAMETDVRIYSIELYPPTGESYFGKTMLESLAENTGGRYLPTVASRNIPELLASIDVHRFYRATFTPSSKDIDGRVHRIEMKVAKKDLLRGGKLFWRRGYRSAQP